MPRGYPRFFLSHVTDGKTPGTFIIHALEPFMIMKVIESKSDIVDFISPRIDLDSYSIVTLNKKELRASNKQPVLNVLTAAAKWYKPTPK